MKTFSTLCIILLGTSILFAAPASKKYGKKITEKSATPISAILANPDQYDGKTVLVEGTVADVCQHMGCWITIADGKGAEPIKFKVDDGVITFPKSAKGKKAQAQGVVSVTRKTREELIADGLHEAKEQGTAFDSTSVTAGKTTVMLKGEGAVLRQK